MHCTSIEEHCSARVALAESIGSIASHAGDCNGWYAGLRFGRGLAKGPGYVLTDSLRQRRSAVNDEAPGLSGWFPELLGLLHLGSAAWCWSSPCSKPPMTSGAAYRSYQQIWWTLKPEVHQQGGGHNDGDDDGT